MLFKELIATMDGRQQLVVNINDGEKELSDDVDSFSIFYNQDYLKLKVVSVAACLNGFDVPAVEIHLKGKYEKVLR